MTNKPMLSVERELVEWILGCKIPQFFLERHEKLKELRALLDKPACETCHDQGEVFVSKGKFEYGAETEPDPIYKACPDCSNPAAQHQIRPVGYVIPGDMPAQSGYTKTLNPVSEGKYTYPVYTDQPAPVAVVMPDNLVSHRDSWLQAMERLVDLESRTLAPDEDDKAFWEHELSAMRDMYADFDRLNGVKP